MGIKKIMAFLLAAICLLPLSAVPVGAENNNPATDWFSEALYGIDGPSPPINIPPVVPGQFDQQMHAFDVENAAEIAQEAGAAYMLIGATQVDGYFIAPNPVYDELTGHEPGEKCSTRDLIEEYYQELSKRGIKLMLYFTADGPGRDVNDASKLGWGIGENGLQNETYLKNWFSVAEYWSKEYGDKIAGWWVDGCFSHAGFDDANILNRFAAALKAGNPNAIVCFNKGQGNQTAWDPRFGAGDFIAGETYGLEPVPEGRWLNGQQWHRYLPLYEYNGAGCAYSVPELIDYMKKVKAAGGVVTFGVGASGARVDPFDPMQLEVLRQLKRALREGETITYDYSGKIEAEQCAEMTKIGTETPRLSLTPTLQTAGASGGAVMFHVPEESLFINPVTWQDGQDLRLWAKYPGVSIPEGTNCVVMAVREPRDDGFGLDHTVQLRLGSADGEALCSAPDVGYVDWFAFSDNKMAAMSQYRDQVEEGYDLRAFDITIPEGLQDLYLVGILRDNKEIGRDATQQTDAALLSAVVNGEIAILKDTPGIQTIGHLDGDDTWVYRNMLFGQGACGLRLRLACDAAYAGQFLDFYIDGPDDTSGRRIARVTVPATGGFNTFVEYDVATETITGTHDVYIVCRGGAGIANLHWFRFLPDVTYGTPSYSTVVDGVDNTVPGPVAGEQYVTIKVYKKTAGSVGNTMLVCLYRREDGQLLDVSYPDKTAIVQGSNELRTQITVPEELGPDGVEIAVMVWDDFAGMHPVTGVYKS